MSCSSTCTRGRRRDRYQEAQARPRDPQAEARIQQHFQKGPPGLLYHMAQTLVAQQYAVQEARAQLAECQQQSASQQQSGSPAGFAPPWRRGARRGAGAPPPPYQRDYQPRTWQQPGGQGFLAGAGQLALGVGGGILAAEALSGSSGGLLHQHLQRLQARPSRPLYRGRARGRPARSWPSSSN